MDKEHRVVACLFFSCLFEVLSLLLSEEHLLV